MLRAFCRVSASLPVRNHPQLLRISSTTGSLNKHHSRFFAIVHSTRFGLVFNDALRTCGSFQARGNSSNKGSSILEDAEHLSIESDTNEPLAVDANEDIDALVPDVNGSEDALLQLLVQCNTMSNVLDFVEKNVDDMETRQVIKCILVVWEQFKKDKQELAQHSDLDVNSAAVKALLNRVSVKIPLMNPDELTTCLLYLSKLGVDMDVLTMCQLREEIIEQLKEESRPFPLTALSRFTVAVNSSRQLYTFFMCQNAFGRILKKLDTVDTCEDLRLVTIGLNSLHQMVTHDILDTYKTKVQQLFDNRTLQSDKIKCILKVIQFLNYPHWSQKNTQLLRNLVLLLGDRIDTFHVKELEQVFRLFESQLEPAELMSNLTKRAQSLFEKTPTAELLACTVMYALPDKRQQMTLYAKDFIYNKSAHTDSASSLPTLFKILRLLKISNVYICDGYWSKVLAEIQSNPSERENYVLARHCHRYMHFNNNLGGTYHHKGFEKYVVELMISELQTGITAIVPSKFAKVASFIIAYGHTPNSRYVLPEYLVNKMEDMVHQFKIIDCLQISRGIQIALQMRFKKHVSRELAEQLMRIEVVLNACTERHLDTPDLSLGQLNSILRAYTNRQTSTKTHLFHRIMDKYSISPEQMNSRAIREITFNLNASKFAMPDVCANMLQYIVNNRDFVLGDTVEKVLYCCYNLGYVPQNEQIMDVALHIINRDFNFMSGLSIVQACLAMNFYKALPESLINRVFNLEFIKRLEDEIEMCYSKATYPERVLNQVMQLNRAVCLDCPAAGVPWFQQNYIEAQMSKLPVIKNRFHNDIKDMLLSYLKNQQLLKVDHVTPYGYRIDFVLHFDKNRKPVPAPSDDGVSENINKVAILLLKIDAFCQNNRSQIRGPEILRQRHLEMLGYKVVQVNFNEWSSMYMNLPGARMNYLKELLQIDT